MEIPVASEYTPDDRSEGYRTVGDVLAHVAAKCSVDVDDTTLTRWRQAMGLMREFDTFADEVCAGPDEAMAALEDFSLFAPRYPALAPEALGPETFGTVLDHTRTILELGEQISEETDVNTFIELRKVEAYYTATLIGSLATKYVRDQPEFRECMWRFTGLGIGATLADSLIDARADYAQGKTRLEPTGTFYKRIGTDAMRHAKPHAGTVLDGEGLKLRAKMFGQRITNRLANGITPHSNLHLVKSLWRPSPSPLADSPILSAAPPDTNSN